MTKIAAFYLLRRTNAFMLGGRPETHVMEALMEYDPADVVVLGVAGTTTIRAVELHHGDVTCCIEVMSGGVVAPSLAVAQYDFDTGDIDMVEEQIMDARAARDVSIRDGRHAILLPEKWWDGITQLQEQEKAQEVSERVRATGKPLRKLDYND